MPVTICCGSRSAVNAEILRRAAAYAPALIIDGANYADPHRVLAYTTAEHCDQIYVVETELIYKLRDIVERLPAVVRQVRAEHVFFTTFDALFNYQDEVENRDVFTQVWLFLQRISTQHELTVGVRAGSLQESLARQYARGASWVTLS